METKQECNNLISRATGKAGLCVAAPQEGDIPESDTCTERLPGLHGQEPSDGSCATNTQTTHLVHVDNPIPTDKNNGDLIYPSHWEKSIGGA